MSQKISSEKSPSIITNGSTRSTRQSIVGQYTIDIKTLTGKTYQITVTDNTTIQDIKTIIQDRSGIPVDTQKIVFNGKLLDINTQTTAFYNMTNNCQAHLILRLRGDIGHVQSLFDENYSLLQGNRDSFTMSSQQIHHIIQQAKGDPIANFSSNNITLNQSHINHFISFIDQKCEKIGDSFPEDAKIYISKSQAIRFLGNQIWFQLQSLIPNFNEIVVRRCQAIGKIIKFHIDEFSKQTLQLTLNDDYSGAKLIYINNEGVQYSSRKKGTITLHSNRIVHGVTSLESGVRYSLFLLRK